MTELQYNRFLKTFKGSGAEIKEDLPEVSLEEAAYEMAKIELEGYGDTPTGGIAKYLSSKGVSDIQGRLTDDIYSQMIRK